MFLLQGFDVEREYQRYRHGHHPTTCTPNTLRRQSTFVYRRSKGRHDITGRARQRECYTCGRRVDGEPIGIPISLGFISDRMKFEVEGCYCTYHCAAMMTRFLQTTEPDRYRSSYSYLQTLHHLEQGGGPLQSSTMLPITTLKRFGGFLDTETYHRLCHTEQRCQQVGDRVRLERVGAQYYLD